MDIVKFSQEWANYWSELSHGRPKHKNSYLHSQVSCYVVYRPGDYASVYDAVSSMVRY